MADKPEEKKEEKKASKAEEKTAEPKAEPKTEPKKKPKATKKAKVSGNLAKIITAIEGLSVLELADLVKALEDKFGAVTPMAAAPVSGAPAPGGEEKAEPEKTSFNVVLAEAGENKINAIKTVREINQNLGLKEAKDLVEAAPKEVLTGVKKEEAEEAKKKLEEAGAKVELK